MKSREEIKSVILATMEEVATMDDLTLSFKIGEDTPVLDTGLDSLGFATVVASLELKMDYDPFVLCEDANYPQTLKEFIDFYLLYQPKN